MSPVFTPSYHKNRLTGRRSFLSSITGDAIITSESDEDHFGANEGGSPLFISVVSFGVANIAFLLN